MGTTHHDISGSPISLISATAKDMHGVIYRDQPIMLIFCYAPVLKVLTYYAQYYLLYIIDISLDPGCIKNFYDYLSPGRSLIYLKLLAFACVKPLFCR